MAKWHYLVKGQKQGPVDSDRLLSLAAAGVIREDTPIRPESANEWVELRNSELAPHGTPCKIINAIGKLERIYRDFRFCLGCGFVLWSLLSLKILTILPEVDITELTRILTLISDSKVWLIIAALSVVFLLGTLISWGRLQCRIWHVIPREDRPLSPSMAGVLTSVPVISAVANFWTVIRLSRTLTRQERREGVVAQRPSQALAWVYCILTVLTLSPLFPLLVMIFLLIVWLALARQQKEAATTILHQRLLQE